MFLISLLSFTIDYLLQARTDTCQKESFVYVSGQVDLAGQFDWTPRQLSWTKTPSSILVLKNEDESEEGARRTPLYGPRRGTG